MSSFILFCIYLQIEISFVALLLSQLRVKALEWAKLKQKSGKKGKELKMNGRATS